MRTAVDTLRGQHTGPDAAAFSRTDDTLAAAGSAQPATAPAFITATPADSTCRSCSESPGPFEADRPAADTAVLPSPYRNVSPQELFGSQSVAVQRIPESRTEQRPLTNDPSFQLFLLVLAALYIRFFYRHINDIRLLFARIGSDSISREQHAFDDRNNAGFTRFLYACWMIGLLFVGTVVLRVAEVRLAELCSARIALAASLAVTASCIVLSMLQFGSLLLAGTMTLTQPFVEQLVHLRRTYFAAAFLGSIPVFLLYLLSSGSASEKFLYIAAIEIVIIAGLFLKESLALFISKKIPFLHWILYLCIVECLPISFIALLLARR